MGRAYRIDLTKKFYLGISTWKAGKSHPFYLLISNTHLTPFCIHLIVFQQEFYMALNRRGINGY